MADLDRFLSGPPVEPELVRYLRAAAVLSAFDPFKLNPIGGESTPELRDQVLGHLLPLCEPRIREQSTGSGYFRSRIGGKR